MKQSGLKSNPEITWNGRTFTIKAAIECKACDGTGLYDGMGERDGMMVQCYSCKGTGCKYIENQYAQFKDRVPPKTKVTRVLRANPGICATDSDDYDGLPFGGITYNEWIEGKGFEPGTEMRHYTCPAWWYQSVDYEKKPNWDECLGANVFSSCQYFKNKIDCWTRWDEESGD